MHFVLQVLGAHITVVPLISTDSLDWTSLQHMQFDLPPHGSVHPFLFPSARDLRTESLEPMFEAVFWTYLNRGFGALLKVSVLISSSLLALIVATSFSLVPWQETIRIGLDWLGSVWAMGRLSCLCSFCTFEAIFSNMLCGYPDFLKAEVSSDSLFSSRWLLRRFTYCRDRDFVTALGFYPRLA